MNGEIRDESGVCELRRDHTLNDLWVDCNKLSCPKFPSICCTKCGVGGNPPELGDSTSSDEDPRAKAIREKAESITFPLVGDVRENALNWITHDDGMQLSADSESFIQRYILAVFYFSLGGDNWDVQAYETEWLSNET